MKQTDMRQCKKVIRKEEFGKENEVFEEEWIQDRDGRFLCARRRGASAYS
jgi:hypothetical protein